MRAVENTKSGMVIYKDDAKPFKGRGGNVMLPAKYYLKDAAGKLVRQAVPEPVEGQPVKSPETMPPVEFMTLTEARAFCGVKIVHPVIETMPRDHFDPHKGGPGAKGGGKK